jgi:hypothetical protein
MRPLQLLRVCLAWISRHRQERRLASAVPVDWHVFGSGVHRRSFTQNVSASGAMLDAVSPMPVGAPLVLTIETDSGPTLVHARVAWSKEAGMGVRFTSAHRPTGGSFPGSRAELTAAE